MMNDYYREKLASNSLKKCYEIASERIKQYLDAEISYALKKIQPHDRVLELGCGYGRVLPDLANKAGFVAGIDNSFSSLLLGKEIIKNTGNCYLLAMNALELSFFNNSFDVVVCIQNGISAFHVDQKALIKESIRVTRADGLILFSSYSDKFWNHRLEWFQKQAECGLLGEIDPDKTGDGTIVCKDGFKATTVGIERFTELTSGLRVEVNFTEVDESSLFCEILPR